MSSSLFPSESSKRLSAVRRPSDYLWEVEIDEEIPDIENHPPPAAFGTISDEDDSPSQRSTSYKYVRPQTCRLLLTVAAVLSLIVGVALLALTFGQGYPGYDNAAQNDSDYFSIDQESITSADSKDSQYDHNTAEEGSQSVAGNMLPMYASGTTPAPTYAGTFPASAPISNSVEKPARPPSAGGSMQMYDNEKWHVPPAYIGNTKTAGTVPVPVSTTANQDDNQQEEMAMYDSSIMYDNVKWEMYNGNTKSVGHVPAIVSSSAKGDTTNQGNTQVYDNLNWHVQLTIPPTPTEDYNDSGDSRD